MLIENFAELSAQELKEFADGLIGKINAEHLFAPDIELRLCDDGQDNIVPDEMTGDLDIYVEPTEEVIISREASWTCGIDDNADSLPDDDPEYFCNILADIESAFPTKTISIDGYSVIIKAFDWSDWDAEEVSEVTSVEEEDDGIGSYEYWGSISYDSRPYQAVEGFIDCVASIYISLTVSPAAQTQPYITDEE